MPDATPPERVLMTADAVGGVFTYALTLGNELSRRGVRVDLALMGGGVRDGQREAAARIPGLTLHEGAFALEWMEDPWSDVGRAGDWLGALEQRLRPDVVHLNGYCHAACFRAPTVVVGHSCVLSWWEAVLGEPAPARYDRYRREVAAGLAAASAVVAPSSAMQRELARHYGPIPSGAVVHNGAPRPAPIDAGKEPFVLSAGRVWDRAKNVEALARVAPRLAWPVKVAGSDVHPDGTRRALSGVESCGWLDGDALAALMARASIFALPARYEPFGLCPLEAALRGAALVLGDIESLREVWGDAAVFVPPDDDDALAGALSRLIDDRAARLRLAARGRERARGFTADRMARQTLEVYARATSSRAAEVGAPAWEGAPCA